MHRAPLDLDYFEAGVDFLRAQPQVRSEAGVGLIGISMGSKVVLTMAKFLPPGKISSVVAMCSYLNFLFTDVVYKGSTVLKGQRFDMSKVYGMHSVAAIKYPRGIRGFKGLTIADSSQMWFLRQYR